MPQLDTFVTLSPIPGFNKWLAAQEGDPIAARILSGRGTQAEIEAAAAHYLLNEKRAGALPPDPVARFHLGNGAFVHEVHANADMTANGLEQSSGAMVNYLYDLTKIEKNHEKFVLGKTIPASKSVTSKAVAYGAMQKAVTAK